MIGKYQLKLGADQFIAGMASPDYATDGALGVSSYGLNPWIQPGVMWPLAAPANANGTSVLAGNVIASCEDSQTSAALNRTMIDDAGKYYTFNGTTLALTNTATTNAAYYKKGFSDMVAYALYTYVTTSNGDVDRWNTSGTPALTNSWWVGTQSFSAMTSGVPHPMLTYSGILYIADKNKINAVNAAGTLNTFYPALPLTLATNEVIYALGIDPFTGLVLISVRTVIDVGDTLSARNYIYLWDGISAQYYRKIPVDDMITAFYNVEGTVYVGAGKTIGVWNGNGVTFLRKLQYVGFNQFQLPWKHNFANTRNILHVIDGNYVLSYGAVVSGKRGFYYTAYAQSGSPTQNYLTCIWPGGVGGTGQTLGICYSPLSTPTYACYVFDFDSTAATNAAFLYFGFTFFPRPVFIHRMIVFTTGVAHTGQTDMVISIGAEKGINLPIGNGQRIVSVPSAGQYVFPFDYGGGKCQAIQPLVEISNNSYGITQVIIYYDVAE